MSKKISAFFDDAIGTLDAVGIAEAIATKKISATEATNAAINRAEKVNGTLNAIVVKTYEVAKENALHHAKGDFAGVPTFVKDNENIKGFPTQLGTFAYKSKIAKRNSKFVNQLISTGLNTIGKSTLPEFGLICSTENEKWGITRNPWNTDYTTGGSSSGSAAMVASGVVAIASANDGAGSIRIPASCCGLVGLKPSRNRLINADGTDLLPLNLICEGVLTRTVRDTALFYSAAEKYYYNIKLPKINLVSEPNKKRLKIAFFENIAKDKLGHQDKDTYNNIEKTASLLQSLGHQVEQLPFPIDIDALSDHFLNYYGFLAYVLSNWGQLVFKSKVDKQELEPFTKGLSAKFRNNMYGTTKSLSLLKKTGKELELLFDKYDLIMTPVLAHKVPTIGHFSTHLSFEEITHKAVSFASFTGIQNVTGAPAISLPLGTCNNGLPLGIQFIAPYGHDKQLIELGFELEMAQPWHFIYNS